MTIRTNINIFKRNIMNRIFLILRIYYKQYSIMQQSIIKKKHIYADIYLPFSKNQKFYCIYISVNYINEETVKIQFLT